MSTLDQLPIGHLGFVINLFGGKVFTHFILKDKLSLDDPPLIDI